ncbi:hypothetical protein [Candidatus Williamhamiltonella defendens]|uniref:hypothetical protein n=1 Tax=Candidatus Williamhamiltonella defendens TaxID=138072 RepID=UPI00130E2741|nr:hypothetical protein [Candidatus Hamiltonella defensa]
MLIIQPLLSLQILRPDLSYRHFIVFNKSGEDLEIHFIKDGSKEVKVACPWEVFDRFIYKVPEEKILITTGAVPNGHKPHALPNSFLEVSVKRNISFNLKMI